MTTHGTWRRLAPAVLSLAAGCAGGEGLDLEAEEDVASVDQALYGQLELDSSCSPTEWDNISLAWGRGRNWAMTKPYEVCVRRHVRERFDPCEGFDPWVGESRSLQASKLLAITRSGNTNRTKIKCKTMSAAGETSSSNIYSYGHTNTQVLSLSHERASASPTWVQIATTASVIWHEVTHSHHYQHNEDWLSCGDAPGFDPALDNSPNIVEDCLFTAASGSHAELQFRTGGGVERLGPGVYQRDHVMYTSQWVAQGYRMRLCTDVVAGTPPTPAGTCQTVATNRDQVRVAGRTDGAIDLPVWRNGASYVEVEPMAVISDGADYSGTKWALPEGTYHWWDLGMMHDNIRSILLPAGLMAWVCQDDPAGTAPCAFLMDSTTSEQVLLGGISTIEVIGAASLFSVGDYRGTRSDFRPGWSTYYYTDQNVQSVALAPGVYVELCNADWTCQTYTQSTDDIGYPIRGRVRWINAYRAYSLPQRFD